MGVRTDWESVDYDLTAYDPSKIRELLAGANYDDMLRKAAKRAPLFWGIETNNHLFSPVPDLANRLLQMQYILRNSPTLDTRTAFWAHEATTKEIEDTGFKNQTHVLKRARSGPRRSGKQLDPPPSLTYIEAYREPHVRDYVLKSLALEGDPVVEAIAALEDWRLRSDTPVPEHRYTQLGHSAFELMLFATRRDALRQHVGAVMLETELQLA